MAELLRVTHSNCEQQSSPGLAYAETNRRIHDQERGVNLKGLDNQKGYLVSTVPLDKGYAWFVLFAFVLMGFFSMGMLRSNGIFYLAYMEHFDSPPGNTAWIVSGLMGIGTSGLGGLIAPHFGARKVVFMGALLQTSSFLLSSFVTRVEHLFATITVMQGLGFSFVFTTTMAHVTQYFSERRGLAQGVGTAAASVGSLVSAPLITYLLEEYGLRGTLMIISGMTAHLFIAAMLLRPTSFYKDKWISEKDNKGFKNDSTDIDKTIDGFHLKGAAQNQSVVPKTEEDSEQLDVIASDKEAQPTCKSYCATRASFCNVRFVVHVIQFFLLGVGFYPVMFILFPVYAKEVGFSAYQGAMLLSISGGGDGIGRLLFGWLFDRNLLPRPLLFACAMAIDGALIIVYPMTIFRYEIAAAMTGLVGFFMSPFHIGFVLLLTDKVGIKSIQQALGVTYLVLAGTTILILQFPAQLYEAVGSWAPSYYISGSSMLLASVMIIAEHFIQRLRDKRQFEIKSRQ